jgi:hypothetical protein
VNDPTLAGADDFEPATQRDYLTQAGAEALAHKIAAYWKGLGFEVRVSSGPGGRGLTRQIESDLVRGLPPRAAPGRVDRQSMPSLTQGASAQLLAVVVRFNARSRNERLR